MMVPDKFTLRMLMGGRSPMVSWGGAQRWVAVDGAAGTCITCEPSGVAEC